MKVIDNESFDKENIFGLGEKKYRSYRILYR